MKTVIVLLITALSLPGQSLIADGQKISVAAKDVACEITPSALKASAVCSNGRRDLTLEAPAVFHTSGVTMLMKSVGSEETTLSVAYTNPLGLAKVDSYLLRLPPTIISSASASAIGSGEAAFEMNTTGARLIVLAVSNYAMPSPDVRDDRGNQLAVIRRAGGLSNLSLYYVFTPSTSATHRFSCVGSFCSMSAIAFAGTNVSVAAKAYRGGNIPQAEGFDTVHSLNFVPGVQMGLVLSYSKGTAAAPPAWTGETIDAADALFKGQ